jgi:hypothetical protein
MYKEIAPFEWLCGTSILPKERFFLYVFLLKSGFPTVFSRLRLPQIENKKREGGVWGGK